MKILLISGHGAGDSGAVGNGYKEADLTRSATASLNNKLGAYNVSVTRYPVAKNCYEDVKKGKCAVNFKDYNLVIEVHFNSYNKSAYGTEVLYRATSIKSFASKVTSAIAGVGFKNRGLKYRKDLLNLNTCFSKGVPYILIETCFIDNKSDMSIYSKKSDAVWTAVTKAIVAHYNISKKATTKPATTTTASASTNIRVGQKGLNRILGGKLVINGVRDKNTKKLEVMAVQRGLNKDYKTYLDVDGSYGLKSKKVMSKHYIVKGSKGEFVKAIQCSLYTHGLSPAGIDGYFGPGMDAAVRAYQKKAGLTVDGSVGPKTVASLMK